LWADRRLTVTTPPALRPIQRLRRAVKILAAAGDADGAWVAERLTCYLDDGPRGPEDLEWYLELDTPLGGTPWHEAERLAERDALIVAIYGQHFPELSEGMAAKALRLEWDQYERQVRGADISHGYSSEPEGALRSRLFTLARLGGPPGWRRIRDILAENTERMAS
jgi:hypothetical protein